MLKGAGGSVYAGIGIEQIWEGTAQVAVSFFSRISREGSLMRQTSCLHEWMSRKAYGEQREREMQSISSLLIRANNISGMLIRVQDLLFESDSAKM